MHKIFLIVSMCIYVLTHHLEKISASASDLSSLSTSSKSSLSQSSSASTSSNAATVTADVIMPQSGGDAAAKTISIAYEENKAPAKEISITKLSSSSSSTSLSSFMPAGETGEENLATRRQTRSLFYPYAGGLYSNLYIGYGSSPTYYYPPTYSYGYYPTFYKFWGVFNPYYGYPRVISV